MITDSESFCDPFIIVNYTYNSDCISVDLDCNVNVIPPPDPFIDCPETITYCESENFVFARVFFGCNEGGIPL